ncbi:unnamed protein product [Caenorhabditis bovis]|uniref:Uncharacterized protein n=1 Tax=Caenorhabditis bovis TaxID=2654633 RepID=A0A8S1EL54_9PELO|nr:unnamed protein product [Caenorhabditis bovis]
MPVVRMLNKKHRREHHEINRDLIHMAFDFNHDEKIIYELNKVVQNHAIEVMSGDRTEVPTNELFDKIEQLIRRLPLDVRHRMWKSSSMNLRYFVKFEKIIRTLPELMKDTGRKELMMVLLKKDSKIIRNYNYKESAGDDDVTMSSDEYLQLIGDVEKTIKESVSEDTDTDTSSDE